MDYLGNDVVPAGAPAKITALLAAFVGLLLVIGVVGAFTVSGAGGRYPSGQPASVVAAAANNVASSGALKADMTMTVHGDRTLTFRITGVLDPAQRVGRLVFDPDANLFSEPV